MTLDEERRVAVGRFEAGDYGTAARLLTDLLARVQPDPSLLRLCGMALVRIGAAPSGLPYLVHARQLAPQDGLAALWHGIGLAAAGRTDQAATALQDAASAMPADPGPLVHLARALLQLSRPDDALAAARRAVLLAPSLLEAQHTLRLVELARLMQATGDAAPVAPAVLARAWMAFGLACLRLDQILEARSALSEALSRDPDDPVNAAQLAMVEYLCGEPATAVRRLRQVLAHAPGCGTARLHLAELLLGDGEALPALTLLQDGPDDMPGFRHALRVDALLQTGDLVAARAEVGLALELPGLQQAETDALPLIAWQRARLSRMTGNAVAAETDLRNLASLAEDRERVGPARRVEAHFRLAELRHHDRQYEAAFMHWRQGHGVLRRAQPFSRAQHAALIDTIERRYDDARLRGGARAAHVDSAPVFIVGLPRTGTTLVEQILSAHPSVHGAGERLAMRETLQRITGTTNAREAVERAAALDNRALTAAAAVFLEDLHALAPAALAILDKMPDNAVHLGFIATLLPGARVIVCTRDLRDVGASIYGQRFDGHHPYAHDLADLGWYMQRRQQLMRHWRAVLPLRMIEVDHADWISSFDTTLRRTLDFLDLPYDAACTRFHEQDRTVRTASRNQVSRPVNAAGVGRWRPYAGQLAPMIRELDGPFPE